MKLMLRVAALICCALSAQIAPAQSATGTSATTCNQNGTVLTCTTSTIVTLPSGVNLQSGTGLTQFALTGSSSGPACTGLSASPSTVPAGGTTAVALVVSCPTGSYTYSWASPITGVTGSSTSQLPNLSTSNPSATYSVTVCLASNTSACNTYSATVSLANSIQALSGCSVTASATSVTVGATPLLSVNCSTGTGAGSGVAYTWTRNGSTISGATGSSYQLTTSDTASTGSSTYAVSITNNAPSSASGSAVVTVSQASSQTDYCPSTPVRTTIDAGNPYIRVISSDYLGNFTAGTNFIIQLNVTGTDTTVGRQVVLMNYSDIGANRGGRYVTISKSKCDYTSSAQWVSPYLAGTATAQNAASKTISLNDPSGAGPIKLTTGTWYINVQNVVGSCPSNLSCDVVVDWAN